MSAERHLAPPYPRPPITEAVIEIRAALAEDVTLETLANLHASMRDEYPERRTRYFVEGRIESQAERGVAAQANQTPIGYLFQTVDGAQIAQFRLDCFSFSRLAPYQGWQSFREEARRLWDDYRKATRPHAIDRVGVRYINRLDLPLPFGDFREYLLTVPEVAPGLPQALSGYFMRLEIPHDEERALLIMHQALVPPEVPENVSIILDLDAIRTVDVPSDDDGLWDLVESLRHLKNRAFEACITNRMRGEFF